jgi:ABC-type lipoprotein export system ATPase subunit
MTGLTVRCTQLRHVYEVDGASVVALDDVDLVVDGGSTTAIIGPSGSGKSTLVTLLAGLHRPTSGRIHVGEADLTAMRESELVRLRAESIGVAIQNPSRNLLPYGDARDNVRFAQRGPRGFIRRTLPEAEELLEDLGLAHLAGTATDRLSGGERQRIALAVAMSGLPGVLIADEPTSQLDTANRDHVVQLLRRIAARYGTTVVTVTHDADVAAGMGRRIRLREGRVVENSAS